ncbi:MAG: hypothetical protein JWO40_832 [Candidatus Doudnabacteria bacterium]|nr:hypothetical protein [Candidatus Doudnabacteria bacterium]
MIIVGGIVLLIAVLSFVFLSSKKAPTTPIDNTQTNGTTTNGNGGVTTVIPSTTTGGRDFVVKEDPSQPFASVKPRGPEPVVKPTTNTKFQDYNKAVADGLIPDQNGLYNQVVSANYDPTKNQNTDYTLSQDQFVNTYYPDAKQYIAGQTPTQQQQLAIDPIVSTNANATNNTISLPLNYSGPNFAQSTNSKADMSAYFTSMSNATKSFDVVYGKEMLNVFSVTDAAQLQAYKARTKTVLDSIAKVVTPPAFLGLSEKYYQAYQSTMIIIDDQIAVNKASNSNTAGLAANNLANDVQGYNDLLDILNNDIKTGFSLAQ